MKKKIFTIAFVFAFIFLGIISVNAASNWKNSVLYISDNSIVVGSWKNYTASGNHRVRFSEDSWNSTHCTSVNDTSRLVVSIVRDYNYFVEGQAHVVTKVGTCPDKIITYTTPGTMKYQFETYTSSSQYCGFNSNMFGYGIL